MKYLLFGGPENSCKSSSIYTLAKGLCDDFGFKDVNGEIPKDMLNIDGSRPCVNDFSCILEKEQTKILIWSATDLI